MQGEAVIPSVSPTLPAPARASGAFALLDERDEWLEFSRPQGGADAQGPGTHWESTVVFEGMHCAACAVTIEQALRASPGVREAEVNAASHRGRVVWEEGVTVPSRWMEAVLRSGYRPLPAHDAMGSARRQAETRKMMWRLGVAWLCTMQVMMYAAPEYFTGPGEIDADIIHLLRWAQWLLSIPVVLFSCRPFFANALLDLRLRRVSMDLPVALGMLITFVVSTLGTFEPQGVFGHQVYFVSLTMFVAFLLTGRWLELRLRDRTAGALEALLHRLPESVLRRADDGEWVRVSVRRLRPGDAIRVLPGEAFPADGVLQDGHTSVDEALLTGESKPLARGVGAPVIAGSHNLTAPVVVRVERIGADTRYAQIVALMERASTAKPRIAQLADRLAKPFLIFVLLAAGLACAWWWPTDPGRALMIAVAILVVTCPCALSLATPAAMLASAGALARRGVLVRRLQALEELAEIDTVVFDKTGTLTRDAFVLAELRLRHGVARAQALAWAAELARGSLHPIARALVRAADDEQVARDAAAHLTAVSEVPGQGVIGALATGAGTTELRLGSASFCGLGPMPTDGPASHLSDDQGWLASFEFREELRPDAQATVDALHAQGLRVRLLSGDQPQAAERVGQRLGIDEARGGCTPADKLAALRQAQAAGARVAMVGDGLNDGPVLAGANVSFAFGRSVPLARAQSDFVLPSERLMQVAATQRQARRTLRIVRQNLAWAAGYNAIGVPLAMMGWVSAWLAGLGMAASSLLVVLNAWRLADASERHEEA